MESDQPLNDGALGPFDLTDEIGTSIGALGNKVDRTLTRSPAAAEPMAREEYDLFLEAERRQERRLHKGHPLHNIGVAIHARRPDEARTYFHAAHVEDVRSFPAGNTDWEWVARRMLLELYGERLSLIEKLETLARNSNDDPLAVARRFEDDRGPFESYRGLRAGWRVEGALDRFRPEQLVFCAGSHAQPDRLKALADGVREAGLEPVVVMEFKDSPGSSSTDADQKAYEKSKRLFGRCRMAVFDMSGQLGQTMELEMASEARKPFFVGFISNDPLDKLHGSGMYRGAAAAAGVKPRGCRNNDELRAEVRDWCTEQARAVAMSSGIKFVPTSRSPQAPPQGSNLRVAGSAVPSTVREPPVFDEPSAIPSGSHMVPDPRAPDPGPAFEVIAERDDRSL